MKTAAIFISLLLLLFGVLFCFSSNPILDRVWCEIQEVDINSGKIKYTTYILFIPIHTEISKTELSNYAEITPNSCWKYVNLFVGMSKVSPHYKFHGAIAQIQEIELAWTLSKASPEQRRIDTARLLKSWQSTKSYFAAAKIVSNIQEKAAEQGAAANP
jgi:hypothetical protein